MGWVDWEFWFWFYFLKEYKCFLNKILKKGTIFAHRRKAKQGPKPRFRKLPKNPSRVGKMSWTEIISLRFLRLKQTQCLIEYFWHKESYEVTIKPLEIETVSYSGTSLQNLEITRIKSPKLLSILKLKTNFTFSQKPWKLFCLILKLFGRESLKKSPPPHWYGTCPLKSWVFLRPPLFLCITS